jgi:hypothetical protein
MPSTFLDPIMRTKSFKHSNILQPGDIFNPKRHIESYTMQECPRALIVLPVILRCCLKEARIKEGVRAAMVALAPGYFDLSLYVHPAPAQNLTAVEWTVAATWISLDLYFFVYCP